MRRQSPPILNWCLPRVHEKPSVRLKLVFQLTNGQSLHSPTLENPEKLKEGNSPEQRNAGIDAGNAEVLHDVTGVCAAPPFIHYEIQRSGLIWQRIKRAEDLRRERMDQVRRQLVPWI